MIQSEWSHPRQYLHRFTPRPIPHLPSNLRLTSLQTLPLHPPTALTLSQPFPPHSTY